MMRVNYKSRTGCKVDVYLQHRLLVQHCEGGSKYMLTSAAYYRAQCEAFVQYVYVCTRTAHTQTNVSALQEAQNFSGQRALLISCPSLNGSFIT